MLRRLRIAASAFFAVLTVALCVLSVRSYHRIDVLYGNLPALGGFEIASREGLLDLRTGPENRGWGSRSHSIEDWQKRIELMRQFHIGSGTGHLVHSILSVHLGLLAVFSGLLITALQVKQVPHFSLRTLLIATTLVAVLLGLVVWLGR